MIVVVLITFIEPFEEFSAVFAIFQKYNIDGSELFNDSILLDKLWDTLTGGGEPVNKSKTPCQNETSSTGQDDGSDDSEEKTLQNSVTVL